MNLDQVVELANSIRSLPDDRPEWLKTLPSASDDTALYYRFFHEFVKRNAPLKIIEVGTYVGSSAAHLANANVGGTVLTIDCNPDAKRRVDAIGVSNITSVVSDSMVIVSSLFKDSPFDVCFIDGLHNFNQTYGEYESYRGLVKDGGLIFFDDLALKMHTNEMEIFWEMVPEPKRRLDGLHYTGFGVCEKRASIYVPPWSQVASVAASKMEAFQRGA